MTVLTTMSPSVASVARVLVDSPLPQLDRLFDYAVPETLAAAVKPGVRVTVPLRSARRLADGFVVELIEHDAERPNEFEGALSPIEAVVSDAAVLAPEVSVLARRVADRQAGSASDVLRLAVPPRSVRVEKNWLAAGGAALSYPVPRAAHPITGYETGEIEAALDRDGRLALRALPQPVQLPGGAWVGRWALTLAQAAVRTLIGGRSAIVATADYRDEWQLLAALDALGASDSVAVLDARQTNSRRYAAFLTCLGASPRIVVGNRSAVYAPARRLGLIALFDDGDPLFAEPLAPYAHARDVALLRQEQQGGALVFAGHTRSAEVQRLVELRWLDDIAPVPSVKPHVVATAFQAERGAADTARIPSGAWKAASDALASGPVLVQVASPGYARVLACARCGQAARCTVCAGPLGQSRSGAVPACGWCGAVASNWSCSNCSATRLRMIVRGSGRTAEELGRAFPGVRVIVSDGERPLTEVGAEPALVVATRGAEPVASGGYAAVLLLDGERMLARESLHVGDDCLRWWSNAAALAAPRAAVMLVGVTGPLAQSLVLWQQPSWAAAQLADRRALAFPPAVRVASVTGRPATVRAALDALDGLAPGAIRDVLGPTPVPSGSRPVAGASTPPAEVAAPGAGAVPGAPSADEQVRAIVRFDYAHGGVVATALRGAVIRAATGTRRPPSPDKRRRAAPALRVKFDDPDIL